MSDPFGLDDLSPEWLASKPGVKWRKHAPALAAWVADMDFRPAPVIVDALQGVLDGGDLGYPMWPTYKSSHLPALFAQRMEERHGWAVDPGETYEVNDVMHGLHLVLHLCTEPGDALVMHTPAYPPFFASVDEAGLRLVEVRAEMVAGRWAFDHDALDQRLADVPRAKVLLLCNPQNPTGRVFTAAELEHLARIAERHDLLVVSDEIHADLVLDPHTHVPMATIAPERTVTITSASKSFNLAGLRWAVMHVGPAWLRDRIAALPGHLFGAPNLMAVTATEAAWTRGDDWLAAVRGRIDANRALLATSLAERLPDVVYAPQEATYLAWLDARALELEDEPATLSLRGGVALSPGLDFGEAGRGFVRLNTATSPGVLDTVVTRLAESFGGRA